MPELTILLTAHNRREKTLAALADALGQTGWMPGLRVDALLVDDGSTDGTSEAVRLAFPAVRILQGDGSLYWNGGMRKAFAAAIERGYDYYLWLNDDTRLQMDSLRRLLDVSRDVGPRHIVAGTLKDPLTGARTYGGLWRTRSWHPLHLSPVLPDGSVQAVDTFNGNIVLIPAPVADTVGNLDPAFTHAMGDLDYGLRASKLGIGACIGPDYVGECSRNPVRGTWRDPALAWRTRWRKAISPLGLPPREWAAFNRRYAGFFWPVFWAASYRSIWFPPPE